MEHFIHAELLQRAVKIMLVGAGGTGSRVLESLVALHRALRAKGHPGGLRVTVVDPDKVSPSNIGRQAFYPGDVGTYKSLTLVNRANMALNGEALWEASTGKLMTDSRVADYDIVIGAVDNRAARLAILRSLEGCTGGERYWLDFGNRASDGQVVLGEVTSERRKTEDRERLPHVGELYPDLIDPAAETDDDGPSCSLAEALERQSLYVNQAVTVQGMNILWTLFTKGVIKNHGAFVNLDESTVLPLRVDPELWARFGVIRNGKRQKVVRPSRKKTVSA